MIGKVKKDEDVESPINLEQFKPVDLGDPTKKATLCLHVTWLWQWIQNMKNFQMILKDPKFSTFNAWFRTAKTMGNKETILVLGQLAQLDRQW